jgi:hypothetical protein
MSRRPQRQNWQRRKKGNKPNQRRNRPVSRNSANTSWNLNSPTGFPESITSNLKWTQDYSQTTGSSLVRTLALNGLFGVDLSGGGPRQPLYFDQFMLLYTRYEVTSSQIKITVMSRDDNIIYLVAVYPSITSTPVTAYPNYRDQPYSSHGICGHARGPGKISVSTGMGVRKIVGRNTNSINYTGSVTTNPSSLAYYHMIIENGPGDLVDSANIYYTIEMTMRARFYMRRSTQETETLISVLRMAEIQESKQNDDDDETAARVRSLMLSKTSAPSAGFKLK